MAAKTLLPLSGVAAVFFILASFGAAGSAPGATAPPAEVVSFYTEHSGGQMAAGALLSLGALLLVIFAAMVATAVRRADGEADVAQAVCLAGGILAAVGLLIFAGLSLAAGEVADGVDGGALQAVHVLNQELFFPLTIGTAAFLLGAGTAVVRTAVLPTWLGWAAVVLGIVGAIPSHIFGGVFDHIGFGAFIAMNVWILVVSVLLAVRSRSSGA